MARTRSGEAATLIDRVALGLLSGGSAFLLAGLVWGGVFMLLGQIGSDASPPFAAVWVFSAVMAVLGFVLLENFVAHWIGELLHKVLGLLRALGG